MAMEPEARVAPPEGNGEPLENMSGGRDRDLYVCVCVCVCQCVCVPCESVCAFVRACMRKVSRARRIFMRMRMY